MNKKLLIIGGVIVAIIILFLISSGNMYSVFDTETNSCVFPNGGGICEFDINVNAGEMINSYKITTEFDKMPESSFSDKQLIDPLDIANQISYHKYRTHCSYYAGVCYYAMGTLSHKFYLYKIPNNMISDVGIYQLKLERTQENTGGTLNVYNYFMDMPYNDDKLIFCNLPSTSCPSNTIANITKDLKPSYSWKVALTSNLHSISSTQILEEDSLTTDLHDFAIISSELSYNKNKGNLSDYHDFANNSKLYMSYRPYVYPTNVSYGSRDYTIGTLTGINKGTQDFDFADLINKECDRPTNNESCSMKIRFTSDTMGKITITNKEVVTGINIAPSTHKIELGFLTDTFDTLTGWFGKDSGESDTGDETTEKGNPIVAYFVLGGLVVLVTAGIILIRKRRK